MTEIDKELEKEILKIDKEHNFLEFIFNYCESQEDRKKLLLFIKAGNTVRSQVCLMASQIGIESGNVEGELVEE